MQQHPAALTGIYKVLAKFHNKFPNNVKVACFRFLPCTMPVMGMLRSGKVAKDFAWQQKWSRLAATNPHVCTVLFLLCVSKNLHVDPGLQSRQQAPESRLIRFCRR